MVHSLTSTHHNILSIGGDLLERYEQLCTDKIKLAVEESEEKLLRHQTELRQQAVAEAIAQGTVETVCFLSTRFFLFQWNFSYPNMTGPKVSDN